ncbi:flagellar hook-basal body complex protein FliE [Sporolactobacillus sp. THM7-7]|nr:flagellar hook-basal body complex protein FliE [Sporolactobacillus sp. THM7-7]
MNLAPIDFNQEAKRVSPAPHSAADIGQSFSKTFEDALGTVNKSQQSVNGMVERLAAGDESVDLHNVMIAMQKANVLLRTTVQVRDRVIEAYQEIMRMQV